MQQCMTLFLEGGTLSDRTDSLVTTLDERVVIACLYLGGVNVDLDEKRASELTNCSESEQV